MLSDKKHRMLELLDDCISGCNKCNLYRDGRCTPYWTPFSEYVIVGEAPGKNEVEKNEPFIGSAGKHLWEIMGEFGLRKEMFLIINSVNCRPMSGRSNGKPSKPQQRECYPWIRKYLKVLEPSKILLLGNNATYTMHGVDSGILSNNGKIYYNHNFEINQVFSVHPAMCIYSGEEGKKMLRKSIGVFKDLVV